MKKLTDYIEEQRSEVKIHRRQSLHKFREHLTEEFQNKCGFCNSKLGLTSNAEIDQFYPKSKYPDKAFQLDNLILCCSVCNRNKNSYFPLDKDGLPILLNPRFDNFEEHISITKNGKAVHITERGKETIDSLKLNRKALVEERKLKQLEADFLNSYVKVNNDFYQIFNENIKNVRELNKFSDLTKDNVKLHLQNMLFSNVITSLETYLSDAFINTVKSNKRYLRNFVETFKNFKSEKFELQEIFNSYDNIGEKATKAMLDVIYHDLPKVKGMYSDTLDIKLPELSTIYKAVLKRHDFVHRNGKTKDGKQHKIDSQDIENLCSSVETFINDINNQINTLNEKGSS